MSGGVDMRRAPKEAGFTLIEVLVAFTVAAIMLIALLEGFHRGLDGVRAAERRTMLLDEARNRLADVGARIPLRPGEVAGKEANIAWRVRIARAPASADTSPPGQEAGSTLMQVEVRVRDGAGAELRLHSLRLGEISP